jgi:hypothetical protein
MPDSKELSNESLLAALLQAQQTIALQAQTIDRLTAMLDECGESSDEPVPTSGYLNVRG